MILVSTPTLTHGLSVKPPQRTGPPIDTHAVAIDVERLSFFYGQKQALFYITAQELPLPSLGPWNLAIGFGFIVAGLGLATKWG